MAQPRRRSRGRRRRSRRGGRPRGAAEAPESRTTAAQSLRRTTAWRGQVAGVMGDGGAVVEEDDGVKDDGGTFVEEDDRVVRPSRRSQGRRRRDRRGGRPRGAAEMPEPKEPKATAARSSKRTTVGRGRDAGADGDVPHGGAALRIRDIAIVLFCACSEKLRPKLLLVPGT